MYIDYATDMLITKCIDIANFKGILTAHDIANEMKLARKPSNNPVIVDKSGHPTYDVMYHAICKSIEWLRNYNRAFKKGESTMESTMESTTTVTGNITINADSANVGVDSSTIASSTGYSFTIHNPFITQDIIDFTKPSKDSHLTIEFGDLNDVVNKKLFFTKNFNLPIRPLRYWQTDNGCITVEWTDHTKTTVTPSDPEHADVFSGICIAYTKKMFGSTTAIMRSIEQAKWLTDAPKRNKELARKLNKVNRERKQKRAKEHREAMIERRVEDIKIEQEAQKRIAEEKEASNNA